MDEFAGGGIDITADAFANVTVEGLMWAIGLILIGFALRWIFGIVTETEWGESKPSLQISKYIFNPISLFLTTLVGLQLAGVSSSFVASMYSAILVSVGFSLRDSLGAWLSGIQVLSSKVYSVGQTVQIGELMGKVTRVTTLYTFLENELGQLVAVPNHEVRNSTLISYGTNPDRIKVIVPVPSGIDKFAVKEMLQEVAQNFRYRVKSRPAIVTPRRYDSSAFEFYVMVDIEDILHSEKIAGRLLWDIEVEASSRGFNFGYTNNNSFLLDENSNVNALTIRLADDQIEKIAAAASSLPE